MATQISNLNINCSSYTASDFNGGDSTVKVAVSQIPFDNTNFSIYIEAIHYDSDESTSQLLWIMQPYSSGGSKLSVILDGVTYPIKYGAAGERFNNPIVISTKKLILSSTDPYITFQVIANDQAPSVPPNMTTINNKLLNIRFVIEYSTPFVKY